LIGKTPAPEKIYLYSNELQVTSKTPPTFLVHAQNDEAVKVDNSILFYQALTKNKVPAQMHLYQKGGHGFGLNNPTSSASWFDLCKNWMIDSGWIK
jgi:dipeptidyl aminopeptidase/acylaminoacyl peptidase